MDFVFRVFFLQFLIFGLLVSHVRPQTGGTDCHGKDYLCLDDVRFQLCVDYGDGKPTTVNDEVQHCPQGTFCSNSGHFECDSFVPPSTTAEPHVNVDDDATAQPETEENATNEPAVEVEDATLPEETEAPASNPATEGGNDDSTPANPEAGGSLEPVEEEGATDGDAPAQESSTATVETETNEVPEAEVAVPSEGTELPEQSETTVASETVPVQPTEESAPSTPVPEDEAVETTSQSNNPETEESPVETVAPVEPEVTNPPAAEETSPEATTVAQETEPESVATDAPEVEVSESTESVVTTEQTDGSESSTPTESGTEGEVVDQSSTDAAEAVTTEESLPSEQSTDSVTTESEASQDSSTVAASEAPEQEETEVPVDDNNVAPETTAVPEAGEQEGSEANPSEPSVEPEVSESTSEPSAQPETSESSTEPEAPESNPSVEPEATESSSVSSEPSETSAPVTDQAETTSTSSPSDEDTSSSDPNTSESGSNEGSSSQDSTEAPSAESGAESNEGNTPNVPQAPGSSSFVCPAAGRFANPTDCHKYYVCFWLPFGLYSLEQNCLTGYAYNPTLERCTADQSVCFPGQFTCMGPGRFPDPTDPTQYFWCVWNMFGGYLQYKMQCPMGQVFNPFRGRCAFMVAGTRSLPLDELEYDEVVVAEESTQADDVVVEPTQPAETVAPVEDQPKLKVKFQCLEEGTFADPNNCSRYFVCTLKKLDKFKKSKFKCVTGERFDPLMSMCVPDVDALCE
ncbi:cell surface glycoprotein 1-like [Anopheles funestus]|uniref:cell surface glycoprotein 1-like n=1 Tax=Anopheles funestus TaxID=62324 RepID=UPI0020C6EA09|nr:cell surface glycoprotein 1-like [Anopheles funestus]